MWPRSKHTPQVTTAATAVHRTTASRGTRRPRITRRTMTPTEPSQKTEVTSHLIAVGGGFRACTTPSSAAELARITGMDTATTAIANPRRNASEARRRVVPPPRGPSTTARNRRATRRSVPAPSSLANEATFDMPSPWASATSLRSAPFPLSLPGSSYIIDEPEPVAHPPDEPQFSSHGAASASERGLARGQVMQCPLLRPWRLRGSNPATWMTRSMPGTFCQSCI